MKGLRESDIEKHLVFRIELIGGKAYKMAPIYNAGMPDRQVLYRGHVIFVELKAPGKKPRLLQARFMHELNKMGFETRVIDSIAGIDKLIYDLENEK